MISREELRALARATLGLPVLSVYARTDPRDPANTAATPAWAIELRDGLRAVGQDLEAGEDSGSAAALPRAAARRRGGAARAGTE